MPSSDENTSCVENIKLVAAVFRLNNNAKKIIIMLQYAEQQTQFQFTTANYTNDTYKSKICYLQARRQSTCFRFCILEVT